MYYINAQVKDTTQPIDVNERNFPHIWNSKDFSKAIYIEKRDGDIYIETLSDNLEYIKKAVDRFEGRNDILCEIKWTAEDVRTADERHFGRNATDEEIDEYVNMIDWDRVQEVVIEQGWDIIEAVLP
jgi:hypothetical protein